MNRFLDSLGVATALAANRAPEKATPPNVEFGCIRTHLRSTATSATARLRSGPRRRRHLRLAVGRPSKNGRRGRRTAMSQRGVPNALSITVEISDYYIRQRGLAGRKEVELGTGYTSRSRG